MDWLLCRDEGCGKNTADMKAQLNKLKDALVFKLELEQADRNAYCN